MTEIQLQLQYLWCLVLDQVERLRRRFVWWLLPRDVTSLQLYRAGGPAFMNDELRLSTTPTTLYRARMSYEIDIRFQTRVARSPRVLEIAEAFGIGLEDKEFVVFDKLQLDVKDGDVVYITGQSGGGKSVLLRELARQMEGEGKKVVNLDDIVWKADAALIDQIGRDTNHAIELLAKAGISDAYLYVRRPGELSDGQRYRFRLAKAIETGAQVWVADEFLAILDRTTAKVIAFSLQKAARRAGATLLVATTHTDMVDDLSPDLVVDKRFREKVRLDVFAEAANEAKTRTVTREQINDLLLKGSMTTLTIFTSPTCGPCRILKPKLKAFVEREGWELIERSIAVPTDKEAALAAGVRGVPAVVHEGKVLFTGNIDEPAMRACFEANGVA